MVALQYVGQYPVSDSTVCPKKYADTTAAADFTTTVLVNQQIAAQAATLQPPSYVDTSFAAVAKKTDVTSADTAYVPVTQRQAANGVAALDSSASLISSQRPSSGLVTDRIGVSYSLIAPGGSVANLLGGTISSVPGSIGTQLLAAGSLTVVTTNPREAPLGTVDIPDPGWPWRPIPRGFIAGNASGATSQPATRMTGTGVFGLVLLMPPATVSNQVYGKAVCGGSPKTNTYPILSYADPNQTPGTVPAITGGLTLNLYGSCLIGQNYTFLADNFTFWVDVVPSQ